MLKLRPIKDIDRTYQGKINHLDILSAVKSGNVYLAIDLTRKHLRDSGKSILESF